MSPPWTSRRRHLLRDRLFKKAAASERYDLASPLACSHTIQVMPANLISRSWSCGLPPHTRRCGKIQFERAVSPRYLAHAALYSTPNRTASASSGGCEGGGTQLAGAQGSRRRGQGSSPWKLAFVSGRGGHEKKVLAFGVSRNLFDASSFFFFRSGQQVAWSASPTPNCPAELVRLWDAGFRVSSSRSVRKIR